MHLSRMFFDAVIRMAIGAVAGALFCVLELLLRFSAPLVAAGLVSGALFGAVVGAFYPLVSQSRGFAVVVFAVAGAMAGTAWDLFLQIQRPEPVIFATVAAVFLAFTGLPGSKANAA